VVGTTRFNQRRQLLPLCVGQDAITGLIRHAPNKGTDFRG
jgi:hypothetical protein